MGDRPVVEAGDLRTIAPLHEHEAVGAGDLTLETQATRAEHTTLGVEHDGAEVLDLALVNLLLERGGRLVEPVPHVLILQVAFAGLVADGAIDGVVDEQELEGGAPGLVHLRCARVHHHTVGDDRVARDLELGHLLDFDQAHAAVAVHCQIRMPAEVGDVDSDLVGSPDHRRSRGDLDLLAVNHAFGHR